MPSQMNHLSDNNNPETNLKIPLPCGLTVSHLGFGCSGLMARLSRAESLRLLEIAFDSGITHFDVARMYGYGEAESVVGDFLARRSRDVTIASKVGILPPGRTKLLSAARSLARGVAGVHPAVRRALRRRAEAMIRHRSFDIVSVKNSVETSLRELRTNALDVLLLHDCALPDLADPELLSCLEMFKTNGVVKHFGVATDYETASQAKLLHPAFTSVLQVPNNMQQDNTAGAGWMAGSTVFTHSPLGRLFAVTGPLLASDPALAAVWSHRLGLDATNRGRLGEAFLAAALAANPHGCVLFSSQRPANIERNARVEPNPELWTALRHLSASVPMAASA